MRYFAVLLVLSFSLLGFAASSKAPKWLDRNLAGYAIEGSLGATFVRDPKSGFFFIRTVDCDGAYVGMTLTRDRKIAEGYQVEYKQKPSLPLMTGKGIRIGDSSAAVLKKLGHPSKTSRTGSRKQFVEYRYDWHDVKNGEGHDWANIFTFKEGKLIEITFLRDHFPGEGD